MPLQRLVETQLSQIRVRSLPELLQGDIFQHPVRPVSLGDARTFPRLSAPFRSISAPTAPQPSPQVLPQLPRHSRVHEKDTALIGIRTPASRMAKPRSSSAPPVFLPSLDSLANREPNRSVSLFVFPRVGCFPPRPTDSSLFPRVFTAHSLALAHLTFSLTCQVVTPL